MTVLLGECYMQKDATYFFFPLRSTTVTPATSDVLNENLN